jgi:hypothetical protein
MRANLLKECDFYKEQLAFWVRANASQSVSFYENLIVRKCPAKKTKGAKKKEVS